MKAKLNLYRKFVEEELIPLESLLLNHHYDELYNELEKKRKEVKKLGLWAPYLSKEYGGQNMSFLDFVSIGEVLGRSFLGHYTLIAKLLISAILNCYQILEIKNRKRSF